MTTLFELAIETARHLPPERQDEIARLVLEIASEDQPPYLLTDEEFESLRLSMEQAERRDFADDDTVRAIWARRGL